MVIFLDIFENEWEEGVLVEYRLGALRSSNRLDFVLYERLLDPWIEEVQVASREGEQESRERPEDSIGLPGRLTWW